MCWRFSLVVLVGKVGVNLFDSSLGFVVGLYLNREFVLLHLNHNREELLSLMVTEP